MVIDTFTNREYDRARRAFEKIARRNRNTTLAAMLCVTYDAYHQMQLYRICAQSKCSYAEAERKAVEFSDVFGMDIPTEAFLPNEDKFSNLALDCYNVYQKHRVMFEEIGFSAEDADAFCKMVFFSPTQYDMWHFRAFNSMGYMYSMIAVYDYVVGKCGLGQLMMSMRIFEPGGMKPMTDIQIRAFVKTMIKVVNAFLDIVNKRDERNEKKRG